MSNNKEYYSSNTPSTDSESPNSSVMNNQNNNSVDEEKAFEVVNNMKASAATGVTFSEPSLVKRGLTEVSAMFDRNGKGYLDDTERALRRMDSQNQGYLGIDKVCVIFESLQNEQERSSELLEALRDESKKSMNLKKGVIALSIFTILLALANVGTSFAIAKLVKDTQVDNGTDLTSKASGERIATTSKLVSFEMNSLDETRRRHLQTMYQDLSTFVCVDNNPTGATCELSGVMNYERANALHNQLDSVERVTLKCNGRTSSIEGGAHLQGQPGETAMLPGYAIFPDASNDYRYQATQSVRSLGSSNTENVSSVRSSGNSFCDAQYDLQIMCPLADKNAECLVFTAYLPTLGCATTPTVCGPRPPATAVGNGNLGTQFGK